MVIDLKLYHPNHFLGWIWEQLSKAKASLDRMIREETNPAIRDLLSDARDRMACAYCGRERAFKALYNDMPFCLEKLGDIR